MTQWIDFKLLKQQLCFETVLDHYSIKATKDGDAHVKACCPFHDDKRPSLGVDLKRKIWQCFACKTSGNVLDFVTRMEGLDPSDAGAIRKGAETAIAIMSIDVEVHKAAKPAATKAKVKPKAEPVSSHSQSIASGDAPIDYGPENAPLSFELKLEKSHPFMKERGFKPGTYEAFGIGYCKRGMMKELVCFPLRNADGTLIGYAGRKVSAKNADDAPDWLYPPKFNPSKHMFNWHRHFHDPQEHITITGSLWDVLASHERGVYAIGIPGFKIQPSHVEMLANSGVSHVDLIVGELHSSVLGNTLSRLSLQVFVRTIITLD